MKKRINLILKLTLICTFYFPLNANNSIYSKVNQYHINSFKPTVNKEDLINSLNLATGEIDKTKLSQIIKQKFTEPRKYTEIILNLFDYSEKNKPINPKLTQTSKKLFENLEILCGEHTASSHLLSKIDRTKSFAGRSTLAKMLIEPTTDINELNRRQDIIKELVKDQETFDKLNEILENYSLLEKDFLSFFEEKAFNKLFGSENYFPHMFWQLSFILNILPEKVINNLEIDKLADDINSNNLLITSLSLYNFQQKIKNTIKHAKQGIIKDAALSWKMFNQNKAKNTILLPFQFFGLNIEGMINDVKGIYHEKGLFNKFKKIPGILFGGGDIGQYYLGRTIEDIRIIYSQITQEKKNYLLLKDAFKKLQKISSIIGNIEEIKNTLDSNDKLKMKIKCFSDIKYMFENQKSDSPLFDKVLKSLKSENFKKKEVPILYLLLLKGKVLSTSYLLAKTQIHLVDFIKSIGQIDAYLSIAKLYKESLNKEAKYCFADYETSDASHTSVSHTSVSHINMEKFWTPFIDQEAVVTNNIELGGTSVTKCALISGPNAGGKSTVLKSIILNALLSQTITIAAATKCVITPFSYIDTYLNITDDISGGNSLFKSEVLRVKDMLNKIENNGKSLIIVDEMFSGTNPKEGEASSYAIAEFMAQLAVDKKQIIALMASHYSEMTKLEKNTLGIFKNYKVSVNVDKNSHKLDYPFKLQEGKSNQKIAIDILQAEGLSQKIIDSARKIASRNELLEGV